MYEFPNKLIFSSNSSSSSAREGLGEAREPDGLFRHQRGKHHGQLPVARVQGGSPSANHRLPGHLGRDHHREPAKQPAQQHHLPVADPASGECVFMETRLLKAAD